MRMMGVNVLAVIAATIAIYLMEYVIFAVLMTADQYTAMSGYVPANDAMARMPFGFIPPLFAAIGLALAIKWRNTPGLMAGVTVGVIFGVLFGLGGSLYSYVYGPNTTEFILVNLGHYVACWGVAGAILGAWK
jgi:hypothetical protein